jgi:signal transduction histidine kinase
MACTPIQLLHGVIRVVGASAADPQRALRRLLVLLRRELSLTSTTLRLLSPTGKSFDRTIQVPGSPVILPSSWPLADSSEGRPLQSGQPLHQGTHWYFPVTAQRRRVGVLVLKLPRHRSLPEDLLPVIETACSQLGLLVRRALAPATVPGGEALAQLEALSAENDRKFREISLLYRLSRAMHSTLQLNQLMHLILSAATVPAGAGFERAMLFMVNERSGILQGMLGVTRETAALVLPEDGGSKAWEQPEISAASREAQHQTPFCREVMKLRFSLDGGNGPLGRSVREKRVIQVPEPMGPAEPSRLFPDNLGLSAFACAPLYGRNRALAVLVVDNPSAAGPIPPGRLRFLELFASQAGAAMENSMLVHRLKTAHQDLQETQDRLLQGEKMAALGEMAASVAHELKNPLVAIGGFAQRLARQFPEAGPEREYAAIIAREVQRMEKMLGNILAFSKKHLLCFVDCRVQEIMADALAVEAEALMQGRIETVTEFAEVLPTIVGDGSRLRQVFINLLINARQAMEPAGGRLTIRIHPSKLRGEPAVAVAVEDTGGGVTPEVMRNMFNPFFTTKDHGTGLGLSISHRIIEQHQGELEVKNRAHGAAFIVRLPANRQLSVDK